MEFDVLLFVLVGFLAQVIDGSLGMAYGVSASSFLLSLGVSPAVASASVHTAEVFTTAISGYSHYRFGNVEWPLIKKLAIPGMLGGILGAFILTSIPGDKLKPFVAAYMLAMGVRILLKAAKRVHQEAEMGNLTLLGLAGGFFDAVGGGGWGPIVTSTLVANGNNPRKTIGSVNLTEAFVTFTEAVTFFIAMGITHWQVIVGLVVGGAVAAPFGAYLTKIVPARIMMVVVGGLIIFLSLRTILLAF